MATSDARNRDSSASTAKSHREGIANEATQQHVPAFRLTLSSEAENAARMVCSILTFQKGLKRPPVFFVSREWAAHLEDGKDYGMSLDTVGRGNYSQQQYPQDKKKQ
jgi:hypothetical protein